jgi:outer membrane protein OmpA-like peptidoglycan-associated protein|tara:strand:- start:819 stop:1568 length:750 start_codon:yes stop_codon:yes gene_type:complete
MHSQYNVEHSVYFDTDEFLLTKTEQTRLQKLISSLSRDNVIQIEIYGFCDDRGGENYNLVLSQNRANSIKSIFNSSSFFPEKISTVDGKGELLLNVIDDKDPSVLRALNRRVDVVISYPEDKSPATKTTRNIGDKNKFVLENVLFITGYSYVTRNSKKTLSNVVKTIKEDNFSFIIQGHVCCTEGALDAVDKKTNKRNLSVARAKFVYDYFIKNGIDKSRMSYEGLAHKFPLGGSADKDRRVEILIVSD